MNRQNFIILLKLKPQIQKKASQIIKLLQKQNKYQICIYFYKQSCLFAQQVSEKGNSFQMNKILLPDYPGNNLLFHCVSHGNAVDALNLLQNKQAQVNARNVNGCTPLHMAVMIQNINLVRLLLKYGADVNLKQYNDVGQKTALHYAVEKNNFQITNILLDNGANPCLGDKRQMTALHYAARFGFKQIVKLLMTYGADINVRDMNGFNSAQWAKMNEFPQIVQMIGPQRSIKPEDYQQYKKAMIQIHQINLKKKKKKGKKKK